MGTLLPPKIVIASMGNARRVEAKVSLLDTALWFSLLEHQGYRKESLIQAAIEIILISKLPVKCSFVDLESRSQPPLFQALRQWWELKRDLYDTILFFKVNFHFDDSNDILCNEQNYIKEW